MRSDGSVPIPPMKKENLRGKLINFQKAIVTLSRELDAQDELSRQREDGLFLELASVLDSFENVFNNLKDKEQAFDKSAKRAMKSFRGIHRKLLRILEDNGVERLEFPDGKAEIGLCKVVDTESMAGAEEGSIISVVRDGYRRGDRILRPAEVITVTNREQP
jgi:molecular chaperone GrpE (heat shock protein)